jgi:hypothetical protein
MTAEDVTHGQWLLPGPPINLPWNDFSELLRKDVVVTMPPGLFQDQNNDGQDQEPTKERASPTSAFVHDASRLPNEEDRFSALGAADRES